MRCPIRRQSQASRLTTIAPPAPTLQITPLTLLVKAPAASIPHGRSMGVRTLHTPQRMSVFLQVLVARAAWRGAHERADAEAEEEELRKEDGDCGVEGEAL